MTLRPALTASLALALLTTACAPLQPAPQDSLAAECPRQVQYAAFGDPAMNLAELQQAAALRLAPLGLRARWQAPEGQAFEDSSADRARLRGLLAILLPAYERYPPALFERLQLRQLEFVKDLRVAGQLRRAMPAAERDALAYADIGGPPPCPAGIELRAHHELYHLIDFRLFGNYYARDPRWLALNPATLQYGAGGATAYGKAFQNLGHPQAGAVSRYALYGPEEDKAEVFGWLMTPAYAARLHAAAAQDPALQAKREFMLGLLGELSGGALARAQLDAVARGAAP